MAFIDWIRRCNSCDLSGFRPFLCAGNHIGWVHETSLPRLAEAPDVFTCSDGVAEINPALASPDARTEALSRVTDRWFAEGALPGWRGEHYRAAIGLEAPVLFSVERAAAPLLGLRAWGVHVNGFVHRADGLHMWVAKRATGRPVAPGKWDHLIAGGLTADMSVHDTLIKEADEEAGLPAAIAAAALPVGHVSYCFVDPGHRLRPDMLVTYDLELPDELTPVNTDGEVEHFALWPIGRVIETVRDTEAFKTNCNLVIIDFLIRHGLITAADTPDHAALAEGLRQPFLGWTGSRGRGPVRTGRGGRWRGRARENS